MKKICLNRIYIFIENVLKVFNILSIYLDFKMKELFNY